MSSITVELWQDSDVESPTENDGWKLYSFGRKHSNFKDPYDSDFRDEDGNQTDDLAAKLKSGLAFELSYYEHGQSLWMLRNSIQWDNLPDKRWDGVARAGLLIWEGDESDLGPKTVEDRRKDAEAFVETYTAWCNGETYGFTVKDAEGEDLDRCGGFIGVGEHLYESIRESTPSEGEIKVAGPLAFLLKGVDLRPSKLLNNQQRSDL